MVVDASMCYVLPDSALLELAALIEPLSVAYRAALCADVHDRSIESVPCIEG